MIKVTDKNYWMDGYLRQNLNSIIHNMKGGDWDSVAAVSGSGLLRVGKTMIACQSAYYCAHHFGTPFTVDNIVFSGDELIKFAHTHPHNSVIVYDEARAELDTKKQLQKIGNALKDFFSECGMYNDLIFVVLPDFFELARGIAVQRSEFLINVYRKTSIVKSKLFDGEEVIQFERGFFEFFDRRGKRLLWLLGKKNYEDYSIGKKYRKFHGNFREFWVVDRSVYEKKKLEFLTRDRQANGTPKEGSYVARWRKFTYGWAKYLVQEEGKTQVEAANIMSKWGDSISNMQISNILRGVVDK